MKITIVCDVLEVLLKAADLSCHRERLQVILAGSGPKDLANKIDWWLDHPQERAQWGSRYAENAAGQFDQQKCMEQMERMLLETAGKRP